MPCVVVDGKAAFGEGSRGLCYAKRTLEILDRLGVGERAVAKGVTWQLGKVFHGTELLYQFNLLPEGGHKMPAFINLQQYYIEQYLYERCPGAAGRRPALPAQVRRRRDLRRPRPRRAGDARGRATRSRPTGWSPATARARTVRQLMGLSFEGRVFEDRFLIADIRMPADYPAERWFWFDPPFNPGQSALLHKQPDDIWRIDLQLGRDADPAEERKPERVRPRLEAMLGKDRPFEFEWISVYTFQCRRLERFVHGPVIFAGDAAHLVSPFGARGFNSGVQDTDNLAWKLAAVAGRAGPAGAARHLRPGARGRGRREPAQLDPLDRLHHAQVAARRAPSATPRCRSRPRRRSPAPWSTPAASRRPPSTTRRSRPPTPSRSAAPPGSARRCPTRRWPTPTAAPAWLLDRLGPRLHPALLRRRELPCALPGTMRLVRIGHDARRRRGPVPAALRRPARLGLAGPARPAPGRPLPPARRRRARRPRPRRALGWELPA